jgi:hypothetical protein
MSASYIVPPKFTMSGNRTHFLYLIGLFSKHTTYSSPEGSAALEAFGMHTGALIDISGSRE